MDKLHKLKAEIQQTRKGLIENQPAAAQGGTKTVELQKDAANDFGLTLKAITNGAVVSGMTPKGPAENSKELQIGDIIVDIDGTRTAGAQNNAVQQQLTKAGQVVTLKVAKDISKLDVAGLGNKQFPFENLVFEGGGSKGVAYCGAIEALEIHGIMANIKRFAGSSAGGMTAALLAVGCSSKELRAYLGQDLKKIVLDHSWGCLSLLPGLLCDYGWNPGNNLYEWFGKTFQSLTGEADITFAKVHEKFGKELCIVVTNVNAMTVEYCSPRTTPNMAVRLAVRMTMAIPVLFKPVPYQTNGKTNFYVDGGVLCNYPIHYYDGDWCLKNDQNEIDPANQLTPTLGFLVYDDDERDIFQTDLRRRANIFTPRPTETRIAKKKIRKKERQDLVETEQAANEACVRKLIRLLLKQTMVGGVFTKAQVTNALGQLPKADFQCLFGGNVTAQVAADILDTNGDGKISFDELLSLVESNGLSLQECFLSYQRQQITGFASFAGAVLNAVTTNLKRLYVKASDIERTVGINTGHIGTADFALEKEDITFAVEQGKYSTEAFLDDYVKKFNLPKKT